MPQAGLRQEHVAKHHSVPSPRTMCHKCLSIVALGCTPGVVRRTAGWGRRLGPTQCALGVEAVDYHGWAYVVIRTHDGPKTYTLPHVYTPYVSPDCHVSLSESATLNVGYGVPVDTCTNGPPTLLSRVPDTNVMFRPSFLVLWSCRRGLSHTALR